ncbi:MAG: phosphotriesterase-related protein [Actinomyces sp.]|nr:MAG: phosphotriesterase-related protein [Actinomyces sp.]
MTHTSDPAAPAAVMTVTGPVPVEELGRCLMHEHLTVGYPGWESDTLSALDRADMRAICIDRIAELQDLGYRTLVDPCPNDLGRDVELMVEVAEATGFRIICATGLYKHDEGGHAHWAFRGRFEDVTGPMTDLFVTELTEGIGTTGVRAGIIKCGTGTGAMTDHEARVFAAAAAASGATGAPVTTHTDEGTLGDVQQEVLTAAGVPAHRIVIGHSCGTTDTDYHLRIARGGSWLGFDRFGIPLVSDDDRVASLARLVEHGAADRVVVSHDSVWCWKGQPWPVALRERVAATFVPTHFDRTIVPRLLDAGVDEATIAAFTHDNPRRFFAGEPLPNL